MTSRNLAAGILAGVMGLTTAALADDKKPEENKEAAATPDLKDDQCKNAPEVIPKSAIPDDLLIFTESAYDSNGNSPDTHYEGFWAVNDDFRFRSRHFREAGESTYRAGIRITVPFAESKTEISLFGSREAEHEDGLGLGVESKILDTILVGGSAERMRRETDDEQLVTGFGGIDLENFFFRAGYGKLDKDKIGNGQVGFAIKDLLKFSLGGKYQEVQGDTDIHNLNCAFSIVSPGKEFGLKGNMKTGFNRTASAKMTIAVQGPPGSGAFSAVGHRMIVVYSHSFDSRLQR